MSKLDKILQNNGNLNYRLAKGKGNKTQYELELEAKEQIKDFMLELIDNCFKDNTGYIDDKLKQVVNDL